MVSLKLFAGTDVGLRENNEDNFIVCPDLVKDEWIVPADYRQVICPGPGGSLMVVADGMGGQNAGEVASAIAIDTVREMFSSGRFPADMSGKSDSIRLFLKSVISKCDSAIKKAAKDNSSTYGMGSTIIIAWLIGHKLYIAWLGDSRAYSFVRNKGIARLSKDHSYVQQLLDAGEITEEEAMIHPKSNVITRSLGDLSQKAKADVEEYDIEDGEVVMLCTDGLCGVCADEEIGGIIEDGCDNLQRCKEMLVSAALDAGGSDNITIALMQVHIDTDENDKSGGDKKNTGTQVSSIVKIAALCLCVLSVFLLIGWHGFFSRESGDGVAIWLEKYTLAPGESTKFHLFREGDGEVALDFDKALLDVNLKDSTLIVREAIFLTDSIIAVRAVSLPDRNFSDSVSISITKSNIEVPKQLDDAMSEISADHEKAPHTVGGKIPEQSEEIPSGNDGEQAGSDGERKDTGLTSSPDQRPKAQITKDK